MIKAVTNSIIGDNAKISNLDELVSNLAKSYNLSPSKVNDLKNGLEDAIVEYIESKLDNLEKTTEINYIDILDKSELESDSVLESIQLHDNSVIRLNEIGLLRVNNTESGYTYEFLEGIDISKLNLQTLIECWNCKDSLKLRELLQDISTSV